MSEPESLDPSLVEILQSAWWITANPTRRRESMDVVSSLLNDERSIRDQKLKVLNEMGYEAFAALADLKCVMRSLLPESNQKLEQLELVSHMMHTLTQTFKITAPEEVTDEILRDGI